MKYYYDLHLHSCLSPCGDDEMTPYNIVNMAKIFGYDIIALTDHNSCANCESAVRVGEAAGLLKDRYLAADGIENVIKVLEELEDEKLNDLDFIELNCCTGGCVGGVLTVENPYVAKARIQRLRRFMPVSCNSLPEDFEIDAYGWTKELTASPAMKLADNVITAMKMMSRLKQIEVSLPGLDCGVCGAPSCRALADDIVRGYAEESDCIFSRINLENSEREENWLPAPFRIKVINEDRSEESKNVAE